MNSCIFMAEVIQDPQLRYTSDTQTPIAEMVVQIEGLREGDPPSNLKVIGWGNLGQDMQANYHQGDRLIIEGRLGMNLLENPAGYKEKKAELTAQRIHLMGGGERIVSSAASDPTAMRNPNTPAPMQPMATAPATVPAAAPSAPQPSVPVSPTEADYDEIPF